ncbi:MAG: hypothetical protein LBL37_00760 [Gracilibacteraceae bacterium]|jgi:hypothetical protein|nr:hypothetical protein [Gracilibacteraceae bacterium]
MANVTQLAEGAVVVGGLALEICGFAAKALGEKALRFMDDPKKNAESLASQCAESAGKAKEWVCTHPAVAGGITFGLGLLCAGHCRSRARKNRRKK